MKHFTGILLGFLATSMVASTLLSCNKFPQEGEQGSLAWNFSEDLSTRSISDLPDTDAFHLLVRNSSGETLYDGQWGNSPEMLLVDPGSYTIKVVSRDFSVPEFSAPQYGDEQVVVVQSGIGTRVRMNCTQLNSGLRFRLSSDFAETYPSGKLKVTSSEGSLTYSSSESRIGYFNPGAVTVSLEEGSTSTKLLSRYLEACEILTLGISCPSSSGPVAGNVTAMSISVDTTRYWNDDDFTIGSGQGTEPGSSKASAYGVGQAKEHAGEKGVWVCGYIVGGDMSSSKNGISFEGPFSSLTNIAIAARSSVTDKSSCMSVQLKDGTIRDALNLVDNPSNLGVKVYLKGDIVSSYYGVPGMQNLTECSFGSR